MVFYFWFHKSYICTYIHIPVCAQKHKDKSMCVANPGIAATLLVSLSQLATSSSLPVTLWHITIRSLDSLKSETVLYVAYLWPDLMTLIDWLIEWVSEWLIDWWTDFHSLKKSTKKGYLLLWILSFWTPWVIIKTWGQAVSKNSVAQVLLVLAFHLCQNSWDKQLSRRKGGFGLAILQLSGSAGLVLLLQTPCHGE